MGDRRKDLGVWSDIPGSSYKYWEAGGRLELKKQSGEFFGFTLVVAFAGSIGVALSIMIPIPVIGLVPILLALVCAPFIPIAATWTYFSFNRDAGTFEKSKINCRGYYMRKRCYQMQEITEIKMDSYMGENATWFNLDLYVRGNVKVHVLANTSEGVVRQIHDLIIHHVPR
jgi:hypothetical protein